MSEELLRSIVARFEESNQLASESLQKNIDRQNRGLAGLPVNWDTEDVSKESESEPDSASSSPPSSP